MYALNGKLKSTYLMLYVLVLVPLVIKTKTAISTLLCQATDVRLLVSPTASKVTA
jgi:hypothetical protein